ncbi:MULTISPECIES: hypothetical protein [Rhodomicrobium]|uniref:peptidoglycan-binding domain-containing protein n=1 Tax=Rhodomicrobium TaxID=1068 RepID=UPI000B4BF952|nr:MULTISPECIES: hypothetical protein [Rhodomicrobium]
MRRFILAALILAAVIVFLSPKPRPALSPADRIAVSIREAKQSLPYSIPPRSTPPQPVQAAVVTVEPVAAPESAPAAPAPAAEPAGQQAAETPAATEVEAPAHALSSAKVAALDAARADPPVATGDLASAAQRELTRLGCYRAGVDGVWGPRSRAAAKVFSDRANGDWDATPSRELISALRAAPDGFCKGAVAAARKDAKPAKAPEPGGDSEASYLPPWMRGGKVASNEAGTTDSDGRPVISDAVRTERRPRARAERRRSGERRAAAQRPQRARSNNWWQGPEGWRW